MIPKTIIHLLSGGIDSTVMLHDLKNKGHNPFEELMARERALNDFVSAIANTRAAPSVFEQFEMTACERQLLQKLREEFDSARLAYHCDSTSTQNHQPRRLMIDPFPEPAT